MTDKLEVRIGSMVTRKSEAYPELNGKRLPRMWRVGWAGTRYAVPLGFSRKRDADAAKRALEAAGIVSAEDFRRVGRPVFERVMIEALDW